ncbi:MAG: hypothetical protein ABGX24_01405 [Aquificota bacterium]|jgi:hypothetical protein
MDALRRFYPLLVIGLVLSSCGKKMPPVPPPTSPESTTMTLTTAEGNQSKISPSQEVLTSESLQSFKNLPLGKGGYFIGDQGIVVLYWDFPQKVDYSVIYRGNKKVSTTEGFTYMEQEPLKGKVVYTIVGYKDKKPIAVVYISVNYPNGTKGN